MLPLIHILSHHDRLIVVRRMMAAQRIDQWAMSNKPVFVDMAAKAHELIEQIDAGGDAH